MSLLKQDTIKKKPKNKNTTELDVNNSKKYKVKAISNSAIYAKELANYLPRLYYLIF